MTLYRERFRVESTRLRRWDYRARAWYFVTICTHQKAHIFGEIVDCEVHLTRVGRIAESELTAIGGYYENVRLDSHIVMPNHVHAIVIIDGDHCYSPNPKPLPTSTGISPAAGSLSAIIRSYKAGVTRHCHEMGLKQSIWQARFHDHILRGDAVISAVREYIWNNPANWDTDVDNPRRIS